MKRIGSREREYVLEVLQSQFRASTNGTMSRRLERAFAEKIGVKYAISHSNGTATLHAALAAAGVGPGDEVIVPPLTMSSTTYAVLQANAVPIFADVDPHTFTIDPDDIRRKITERTRAIIPVALYGLSPDMDAIMSLASRHRLAVIEDAAQCFLGYYKGRVVGSIGHFGSFSFQSSKHITSGEGGMVTTEDEALAHKVRRFSNLGYAALNANKSNITKDEIQDPKYARHVSLGFNYRLPELCAAVALAQVERLEELVQMRVEVARWYAEAVAGCDWLKPQTVPPGYQHVYWTYVLVMSDAAASEIGWHCFRKTYTDFGGDGVYAAWQLTYLEPVFQGRLFYPNDCPVRCSYYQGEPQVYSRGLCLVAESVQPRLLQFKTNYMDLDVAKRKAEALSKTIRHFEG